MAGKKDDEHKYHFSQEYERLIVAADQAMEKILTLLFEDYPEMSKVFFSGERSDHNIHHMMRVYQVCLRLARYTSENGEHVVENWGEELAQASVAHDLYQITHLEGNKIKVHGEMQALLEILQFAKKHGLAKSESVNPNKLLHHFGLTTIVGNHSYADKSVYYPQNLSDAFKHFLSQVIDHETSFRLLNDRYKKKHPKQEPPARNKLKNSPDTICHFFPGFEEYENEIRWLFSDADSPGNPLLKAEHRQKKELLDEAIALFFTADKLDPVAISEADSMFSIVRTFLAMRHRTEVQLYHAGFTNQSVVDEIETYQGKEGGSNCHNLGRKVFEWFRLTNAAHKDLDEGKELSTGQLKRLIVYIDWSIQAAKSMQNLMQDLNNWEAGEQTEDEPSLPGTIKTMIQERKASVSSLIAEIPTDEMVADMKHELKQHFIEKLDVEAQKVMEVLLVKKQELNQLDESEIDRLSEILSIVQSKLKEERQFFLNFLDKKSLASKERIEADIDHFWDEVNSQLNLDAEGVAFEVIRDAILKLRAYQAVTMLADKGRT